MTSRLSLSVPNNARESKQDAPTSPANHHKPGTSSGLCPAADAFFLGPGTHHLLRTLIEHATPDGACVISTRTLSARLGVHRRRVQRRLLALEDHGLIRREPLFNPPGATDPSGVRIHLTCNEAGEGLL